LEVLEDGSVVHINKTTIADTDKDGNSFFFHRAVIHNIEIPDAEFEDVKTFHDENKQEASSETQDDAGVQENEEENGVDAGLFDIWQNWKLVQTQRIIT